jgi:hypothetical protein
MSSLWNLALFFILFPSCFALANTFCPQIANYTMDVRLDTHQKMLKGKERLVWTNMFEEPISELWFHLYWNAFKNNKSTLIKEAVRSGKRSFAEWEDDDWGYCNVQAIKIIKNPNFDNYDLTPTLEFMHPDDDNIFDQTVFRVILPYPLRPNQTIILDIDYEAKVPRPIAKTGVFKDYYFFAQWFPKIGVFQDGRWNCHQHHFATEFFSEYGTYNVKITLSSSFIVGATGVLLEKIENADGTTTHHYFQHSVHDFAWTAYPHFLEFKDFYEFIPGKKAKITLLLQPYHKHMKDRYLNALKAAVTYCSRALMEYPYSTITLVDPPRNTRSAGMEYPTLFTGGAYFIAPKEYFQPETVTIHEFCHQYFYGIVGTNEFENAWMDEGMTSFMDTEIYYDTYGEPPFSKQYFGIHVLFKDVRIPIEADGMNRYIQAPDYDNLQRFSWDLMQRLSYTANAYGKGEVLMRTLQRLMGKARFSAMLKDYTKQWSFKHPSPYDFIAVVNEFTHDDLTAFINQVIFGSDVLDYAIEEIKNRPVPKPKGIFNNKPISEKNNKIFDTEVLVRRKGEVISPVEVLIMFEDGTRKREKWNGKYRWERYRYKGPARIKSAVVDPEFKLLLDINRSNNSRTTNPNEIAPIKWTSKWLLWLQHALEVFTIFGG